MNVHIFSMVSIVDNFRAYTLWSGISDEDVLDTWFSSGLFPFSVHGWPEQVGFHISLLLTDPK